MSKVLESAQWLQDCAEGMEEEGLDRENHARHFRAGALALRNMNDFAPVEIGARDQEIHGVNLLCTCQGCPEQYDLFLEGDQIGYIRLRWSILTAEYIKLGGGREVFRAPIDIRTGHNFIGYQGSFKNESQRRELLSVAVMAVLNIHKKWVG